MKKKLLQSTKKMSSFSKCIKSFLFLILTLANYFALSQAFYNTNTSTGGNAFPLNSGTSNKVQWIYGPNVFNTAGTTGTAATAGVITKVYFRVGTTASPTFTDFTISLAQNQGTSTAWTSGTFVTGLTQCFYQASLATSTTSGTWYGVTLQNPFSYDPSKSLVFEMKVTSTSGTTSLQQGSTNQRIFGAYAATTGTAGTGLIDFGFDLQVTQNDVGITALVNPLGTCGNTSEPLIVRISNRGSNALSTGLNIPVTAVLSGAASGTYTKNFNRALGISATDTIHLGNINTSSFSGNVNVKSWSRYSADTALRNDSNLTILPFAGTLSNQPTALNLSPISNNQINGSFTAASHVGVSYLVVRYPSGFSVTNPTDGVVYAVNSSIGAGTVVQVSNSLSFSATGLSPNTAYDFYIYTSKVCGTGSQYLTNNPLKGTLTTNLFEPTANNYVLGNSTGAVLDDMNSSTTLISTGNDDTPTGTATNIGFNFAFEDINYTTFWVSPDGWLKLGGTSATSAFTNGISNTAIANSPLLCAYWDDMATGNTGSVKSLVTGTSPNRILKVQWNVTIPRNVSGDANSTFQIWLYETSNKVEFRYGNMGSATMSSSVGIRGLALNPAKFLSLTLASLSSNTITANDANAVQPLLGHMYSFVPPFKCPAAPTTQPTGLTLSRVTGSSSKLAGTFTAASGSPNGYLVVSYPKGSATTAPTNGVYYFRGNTLGLGTVQSLGHTTSFIAQDLLDTTSYDIYVYSSNICSDGPIYNINSPLKATEITFASIYYYSTNVGGLWSSPQTWQGEVVPPTTETVVITNGAIVTVDLVVVTKNLIVGQGTSGILQWNATSNAMNILGNITVNSGASFLPYTTGGTGVTVNIGGNFTNNGYVNAAAVSCLINFNGSQVVGGSYSQSLTGNGTFQGNGTYGIIRGLAFQTTGSSTISTSQNLVTSSFIHSAGNLNTNGLLTIDNTTQVYGQQLNLQVASVAVTAMGVAYTNSPVVFGAASSPWLSSGTGTSGTRYFSGNNVYLATSTGTFGTTSPSHSSGSATNGSVDLLWIGEVGTLGNPFQIAAVTVGTQYFYGSRLYVCTVAGTPSATAPPTHGSGTAASGSASFRYVGSPAKVSVNFSTVTKTVRSLNILTNGNGYSVVPTLVFNLDGGTVTTAATAVVTFFQQIIGPANSTTQKSGSSSISGGININSTQGAAAYTGVGELSTTGGGVNYSVAPTVGFTGPSGINLVTSGGSGYSTIPTITLTGGTLISGTALTSASFTITLNQGKVVSVYLSTPGTACYSTPPTLSFSAGSATLAFPSGCWPSATANIGSNGQITSFSVTNSGFGYVVAPTVGIGTTGTYTTVATAPTARIALYTLIYNNFAPSPAAVANTEGAEVPSSRKLNQLQLNSPGLGASFTNDLEIFGTAPLTLSSGTLNMNNKNLLFTWNGYAGAVGSLTANVINATITLTTRGGGTTGSTLNFPFNATLTCFTGTGTSPADGASVLTITASTTAKPSGSGGVIGKRAYRVQVSSGAVYGTNPTVTLNWNALDSLVSDQAGLYIGQSSSLSGSWTTRSLTSGIANTSLATTGSRVTATSSPGPIGPTGDDYYAWVTNYTPPSPLNYVVSRTTSNTYTSILSSGSSLGWTSFSTDDNISPTVTIPSSTFTYQGQTVTGFNFCTNGFLKLQTAQSGNSTTTANSNLFTSVPLVVAPLWEDLVTRPNPITSSKIDSSCKYTILGTSPGSRKIICEWINFSTFTGTGANLNFQAVLDESDNSITFNYGRIQGFNGTSDAIHSYSCGLSGLLINGFPLSGQVLAQQYENTTAFSNINSQSASLGSNGLKILPEAYSSIKFTPGTPSAFTVPSATAPANDNPAGAINLITVSSFPTDLSNNTYTSRFATTSSTSVCAGQADDDVWFKFKASQKTAIIRVFGSGGYLPRVQVLTSSLNLLSNAQCALSPLKAGILDVNLNGLTAGAEYFIRVYHDLGGTQATGTVNINAGGTVTSVSITNQGSGYTPTSLGTQLTSRVRFSGGGGTDALGTAVFTGDKVTGITINSSGYGYTSAPSIEIESPAWGIIGQFSIVAFSKSENDDCAGATNLTGLTTQGCNDGTNSLTENTFSATPSIQATVCGNPDDDIWYKFTAVHAKTQVKAKGTGSFDVAFQVFDAGVAPGSCGALNSNGCFNSLGAGLTDSVVINTTIGNTYYLRVYHAGTGTIPDQSFTICVTSAVPNCVVSPTTPANSTTVCAGTVNLKWPSAAGATEYDIYLDKGATSATTLVASNVKTNFYNINLTDGNYVWKIIPKNIFGEASGCTNFTFSLYPQPKIAMVVSDTCAGANTKFVSASTVSGSTIVSNNWKFGDGNTANGTTVNNIYSVKGVSYNVKLISTSALGCIDSGIRAVLILSPLVSGSISSDQSICYNTTPALLTSTSSSSGSQAPYFYQWQSSANGTTFTNISGATGLDYQPGQLTTTVFYRRLTTTVSGCGPEPSNVVKITTNPILNPGVIGSPQTICFNGTGSAISFSTTPTGALGTYTYQWEKSSDSTSWSNISGQTSSTFTPTNVTAITYYRSVVTSSTCPSAATNGVKIKLFAPITGGTIASGQTICAGYTASALTQVSAATGGPGTYTYQWQSSNDSINWNNVSGATSIGYSPGTINSLTYFQRLAGSTGCPSGLSNAIKIRTLARPNTAFTPSNHCFNDPMPLSNTSSISTGTLTYLWKFGDGTTSTSSVPNKTYGASGTYNVTLVSTSNSGCKDSLTKSVIVATTPTASFTYSLKCAGDSAIFVDNTLYACAQPGLTFLWNFGDGTTSTDQHARHHYSAPGTYTVKFRIALPGGFKDSVSKVVVFNIRSTPSFTASSDCSPAATTFTNSSSNYASLAWSFGDGGTSTTTSASFTRTYATAGTYTAKLISTSTFGCKDSMTRTVNYYSKPKANFSTNNSCLGTSASFSNLSSGASTYLWNFGDGTTSTSLAPTNSYASANTYTVKLRVTSSNGCIDSTAGTVTIYPNPVASFTVADVCNGFETNFNNTSTGATTFNWSFGNGTTSTIASPKYTYPGPGTYTVSLLVSTSNGCTNSTSKTTTVNGSPKAAFTSNNVCLGLSVNFTNSSTGASTNNWSFGDATTSTTASPTKTYATAGNFNVKLLVATAFGCKDSITKTTTIYSKPIPAFTANNQCFGTAISFVNQSTNNAINVWRFGDGQSSASVSPAYAYATAGTYTVKLVTTSSNSCTDSISKSVTVFPKPSVSFTANPNPICRGGVMTFTNTTTNGSNYSWKFGNGNTSTATSPTNVYTAHGNYTVRLISTSTNGCRDSIDNTVTVWPRPVASFSVNNGCTGDNLAFVSGSNGVVTHAWSFGDATTSTVLNPSKSYTTAGTYNVNLIITSTNGCKDTTNANVTVYPRASVSFTNPSNFCVGLNTNFTNTSTLSSGNMTYQWNFGDGNTSSAANPTNMYAAGGNYTVTLSVTTDKGCVNTNTSSVLVFGKPTANFSAKEACAGANAVFTNNTLGTNTYTWDFGDGSATSNLTSPTRAYTNAGTYTVKLTVNNANNCTDFITKQLVIYANPIANFTVTDRCIGQANSFVNTSTGANDVFWQFGDGNSSNSFNPSYTYSTAGTYSVILNVKSKDGCASSITKTTNSFARPKATFTVNDDGQCINGNNFAFTDNSSISSGTFSRNWSFGDGGTSTNTNPSKTYATEGTFNVKLLVNSTNGCRDSANATVMVYPKPIANFNINNNTQCLRGNLFLFSDASSISNGSMSRVWNIGDGNTYGGVAALKNYDAVGNYTIRLSVFSDYGCADSISKTVTVNASPVAEFKINDEIQCLNGNNFIFTNTTLGASGYANSWRMGDGFTANTLNASRSYAAAGNYRVSLNVVTPFGCKDSAYYYMVVRANPANLTISGPTTANNGSVQVYSVPATIGSSYNWVATNGVVQSNGSNLIQVKWNSTGATGSVSVIETNANECVGNMANQNVTLNLVGGVGNLNRNAFAANLYPNPNTNTFTIEVSTGDMVSMYIFDQLGRQVMDSQRFSSKISIEDHDLPVGIYTVKLETDKGKTTILRFEVKH